MFDIDELVGSGTPWQGTTPVRRFEVRNPRAPSKMTSTVAHHPPTTLPVAIPDLDTPRGVAAKSFPILAKTGNAVFALVIDGKMLERGQPQRSSSDMPPALHAEAISGLQGAGKPINRHLEHLDYLKEVSTKGERPLITRQTAILARRAWWMIWEATAFAMPVPAACTGPDGEMLYTWDRGKHHLELEIIPGQAAEFFYRDRETEELWGEDYAIGEQLSEEAICKLKFFI